MQVTFLLPIKRVLDISRLEPYLIMYAYGNIIHCLKTIPIQIQFFILNPFFIYEQNIFIHTFQIIYQSTNFQVYLIDYNMETNSLYF